MQWLNVRYVAFSFYAICVYFAALIIAPHSKHFGYLVIIEKIIAQALMISFNFTNWWGEGWHNYHHTISKDYRHGHKWWELGFMHGLYQAYF